MAGDEAPATENDLMMDESTIRAGRIDRRGLLRAGAGAVTSGGALAVLGGTAAAHFPETLEIDVTPMGEEGRINPGRDGLAVVAVLYTEFESDGETVVFDPTERPVNYRFGAPDTVADGGGGRPVHGGFVADVDDDGQDDLLLTFPVRETGFTPDDTEARLEWERHEGGGHGLSDTADVTMVGQ